jgi:hypothetical protein
MLDAARAHIEIRVGKARRAQPLIGEYAPWLAADMLGVRDMRAVQGIAVAWLHLYFFTLILDDAIDDKSTPDCDAAYIASCLLLQRGISDLLSLGSGKDLRSIIDTAFVATATAAFAELREHRNKIMPYTGTEVAQLGQKIGLLPICAAAVAHVQRAPRANLANVVETFEHLANAIQLLDDLTDWKDDERIGSQTLPLTLRALRYPRGNEASRTSTARVKQTLRNDTFASMLQCSAIEETLAFAIDALRRANACVRRLEGANQRAALTKGYIEQLLNDCIAAESLLSDCRVRLGQIVADYGDNTSIAHEKARIVLRNARKALYVVAQKS